MAIDRRGPWYWERYVTEEGTWTTSPPPGEELAALRAGLGRQAGEVPALWPYYRAVVKDELARRGIPSAGQRAEHAALALYGLHQQSKSTPMHVPGASFGVAIRELHRSGKFSEEAVNRRVSIAAQSPTVNALLTHVRGLVSQLRTIDRPVDYTKLLTDIYHWNWSRSQVRVRRRWGTEYFGWSRTSDESS